MFYFYKCIFLTDGLKALWLPQTHNNPREIKASLLRDTKKKYAPCESGVEIY